MARAKVTGPDGEEWRVWRRWYVWRRRVTMRDVWRALPGTTSDGRSTGGDSVSDFIEFIIALPFLLIAAVGLVFSLVDLVFQLVALPFAVLSRLVRLTGWPSSSTARTSTSGRCG